MSEAIAVKDKSRCFMTPPLSVRAYHKNRIYQSSRGLLNDLPMQMEIAQTRYQLICHPL